MYLKKSLMLTRNYITVGFRIKWDTSKLFFHYPTFREDLKYDAAIKKF